MRRDCVITLVTPNGDRHDLTARAIGGLDSVQRAVEEDLLELTHDDLTLELDDADAWLSALLAPASPGEAWEVIVERSTGRRRPLYERVFAGVLDVPWSIQREESAGLISLQVFAYSKLLELTSAESVARTVTGRTGTVSAASDTVTLSSTTDLERYDEITLNDGVNEETQTIDAVLSSTQVRTIDVWSDAFTSAPMTLETPYYRNKEANWLAEQLFAAAGLANPTLLLDSGSSPYPQSIDDDGAPTSGVKGLTVISGDIAVWGGSPLHKYTAPDLTTGFSDLGASSPAKGDWWPYTTTEPASLVDAAASGDDGSRAFDHAGGHYYDLEVEVVDNAPVDATTNLHLRQDGVRVAVIDTYTDAYSGPSVITGYDSTAIDYDPTTGYLWTSRKRTKVTVSAQSSLQRWTTAGTLVTTVAFVSGALRVIAPLRVILRFSGTAVTVYDLDTASQANTASAPTGVIPWSARQVSNSVIAIYVDSGVAGVRVWDANSWATQGTYEIGSAVGAAGFLTVWTDSDGVQKGVGFAAGHYFSIAPTDAGTVPYADFEGLSCAAALREIATVAIATLTVDDYRGGVMIARNNQSSPWSVEPVEIDTPITASLRHVSESYRASVRITGTTVAGTEIDVVAGAAGDSAHRLEIASKAIGSLVQAISLAGRYAAYLAKVRRQLTARIEEPTEPVAPLELVSYDDRDWRVMRAESDLIRGEQELELVEEVA